MEKPPAAGESPRIQDEEEGSATKTAVVSAAGELVMTNDVILGNFFKRSTPKELNNYRQVCKHWYKRSLTAWLQNGPVIALKDVDSFCTFVSQVHVNNGEPLLTDIDGIQRYRKITLGPWHRDIHRVDHFQLFDTFLERSGAHLTHFTLHSFKFPNAATFNAVMMCEYTPNLKYLEVDIDEVLVEGVGMMGKSQIKEDDDNNNEDDRGEIVDEQKKLTTLKVEVSGGRKVTGLRVDWTGVLNRYPNLQSLAVGKCLLEKLGELERLVVSIKEVRTNKEMRKLGLLKSLILFYNENQKNCKVSRPGGLMSSYPSLPPSVLQSLRQAQLRLEIFRIHFGNDESEELVQAALAVHAKTVKNLEFYRLHPLTRSPFCDMTQLGSLVLSGFPVENLNFLKELPNLTSLCLWGDIQIEISNPEGLISSTELVDGDGAPMTFPSLTRFCCNYFADWSEEHVTRLQSWMPNLAHLEMRLSNNTFRKVCQLWPHHLEHLSIFGDEVGDKGIVGLEQNNDGTTTSYSKPNITSLTQLKSLAIDRLGFYAKLGDEDFTWRSVVNGILELPHLEKLYINVNQMSDEAKKLILEKIPFAKVKTNEGFCIPEWMIGRFA